MLRKARRQIVRVAASLHPASHSAHRARTHSGLLFAASFSQLATESCTYRTGSATSGRSNGSPSAGSAFSAAMCRHQTPRGRVISTAKRRA